MKKIAVLNRIYCEGGKTMENQILKDHLHSICEQYYDSLTKLAFSYMKNMFDAQDIVQEVFMSYIKTKPSFENEEHEHSWLLRVTINKCKDSLKGAWRKNKVEVIWCTPPPQENIELLSAVMALPEKYRIPVHLFYYEDMSIGEIAELIHEKPATVGTRLARARKILKDSFAE